jgi:[ribosomal protein S18]-alanine N-acetyltransferase
MNDAPGPNPGGIAIRPAGPADLPRLMAISQAEALAAQWSEQHWLDIFHTQTPPRLAWLAEEVPAPDSARAIGFLVAQCGGAEWELENMAVLAGLRRRGAGSALLAALVAEARARRAERILLEVRASNRPAIRLYEQGGFQLLSRRPGYYRKPTEDALILVHLL